MRTYSDLDAAHRDFAESGGVLLCLGGDPPSYGVMEFEEAVDLRWEEDCRYKTASYFADLSEAGYDETTLS